MIVGWQVNDSWGKAVVERLAADLQAEFPGVGRFSASNRWRMKDFYEAYASSRKLALLVREIAWSHNLVTLERCNDPLQREFYIRMTKKFGWSKNVLIHQISIDEHMRRTQRANLSKEPPELAGKIQANLEE